MSDLNGSAPAPDADADRGRPALLIVLSALTGAVLLIVIISLLAVQDVEGQGFEPCQFIDCGATTSYVPSTTYANHDDYCWDEMWASCLPPDYKPNTTTTSSKPNIRVDDTEEGTTTTSTTTTTTRPVPATRPAPAPTTTQARSSGPVAVVIEPTSTTRPAEGFCQGSAGLAPPAVRQAVRDCWLPASQAGAWLDRPALPADIRRLLEGFCSSLVRQDWVRAYDCSMLARPVLSRVRLVHFLFLTFQALGSDRKTANIEDAKIFAVKEPWILGYVSGTLSFGWTRAVRDSQVRTLLFRFCRTIDSRGWVVGLPCKVLPADYQGLSRFSVVMFLHQVYTGIESSKAEV